MRYPPVAGLLFYVASVAGVATLATELGAALLRNAAATLALDGASAPTPSRVDRGLEAQARTAAWQPAHYTVEARALKPPDISVVALAASIDAAESKPSSPASASKAALPKARVAGWVKWAGGEEGDDTMADADCPARIVERSLKAEM
jgi:hypothetical protein